jgi:hypothetical protein
VISIEGWKKQPPDDGVPSTGQYQGSQKRGFVAGEGADAGGFAEVYPV